MTLNSIIPAIWPLNMMDLPRHGLSIMDATYRSIRIMHTALINPFIQWGSTTISWPDITAIRNLVSVIGRCTTKCRGISYGYGPYHEVAEYGKTFSPTRSEEHT